MHPVVPIVTLQLSLVVVLAVLEHALVGGNGLIWPIIALFCGAVCAMWLWGRGRDCWPRRADVLSCAMYTGGAWWLLGAVSYGAMSMLWPQSTDLSPQTVWMFSPVVGLLWGGAALVLTLCAGDLTATVLGVHDVVDEVDEDMYARFTPRTLSRYDRGNGNRNRTKIPRR